MSDRTFTGTVSTGARILRDGGRPDGTWGAWTEALDVAGADLSRMAGAPLLLDHLARTDFQVGVVEAARVERGAIVADIRFGTDPRARQIAADVADRVRRQLSCGYDVREWRRDGSKTDSVPTFTAVNWTPLELSVVAIGADAGATFRSVDNPQIRTRSMTLQTSTAAPEEAPVTSPDALVVERERSAGILLTARKLGVDMAVAGDLIARGVDLPTASAALIDAKHAAHQATATSSLRISGGEDYTSADGVSDAIATAWAHRCNPRVKLDGRAQQYRGMRTAEAVRHLLVAQGIRPGVSERDVIKRAATTSDFPYLLASATNKALLPMYQAAQSGLIEVAHRDSARDFKTATRLRAGEFPSLLQVNEHGEYLDGSITENRETFTLRKYGRIFAVTWESLVNDDLDAIGTASRTGASSAANLEADLLATVLAANAALSDTVAVFHATHANVMASAVISATSVSEGIALMRKQKGLDATTILNIRPRYLVAAAGVELAARQLVASINPATSSAVTSMFSDLEVVVDPRIDSTDTNAWYLFADPSTAPTLSLAFLEGEEGPTVETQNGFRIDAVEVKVRHVAAAYFADYRGAAYNAGA